MVLGHPQHSTLRMFSSFGDEVAIFRLNGLRIVPTEISIYLALLKGCAIFLFVLKIFKSEVIED